MATSMATAMRQQTIPGGNACSLYDKHGEERHQGDVYERYEDPGESRIFQRRGTELRIDDAQQQHGDAHNAR